MAVLTHGSDLSLAPAVGPVVRQTGRSLRAGVEQLAAAGFRSVQLDATLPGIRPRELNQRARQDLAAMLTRAGAGVAGIDLFIPRDHFAKPDHVDRAMAAATAAIGLAADLGRVPLSIPLPVAKLDESLRSALIEAADAHDVALAVYAEDDLDPLLAWVRDVDLPALGAALDPATLLAQKLDPSQCVHQFGPHLRTARLSDWSPPDRCAPGEGDLDMVAYRVAMDLATNRRGPVVLDVRGLPQPVQAAAAALQRWDAAAQVL